MVDVRFGRAAPSWNGGPCSLFTLVRIGEPRPVLVISSNPSDTCFALRFSYITSHLVTHSLTRPEVRGQEILRSDPRENLPGSFGGLI